MNKDGYWIKDNVQRFLRKLRSQCLLLLGKNVKMPCFCGVY